MVRYYLAIGYPHSNFWSLGDVEWKLASSYLERYRPLAFDQAGIRGVIVHLPFYSSCYLQAGNERCFQVFFTTTSDVERSSNYFSGGNCNACCCKAKYELVMGSGWADWFYYCFNECY